MSLTNYKKLLVFTCLYLGSCTFTTYLTVPGPTRLDPPIQVAVNPNTTCPIYQLPESPELPAMPIARINSVKPSDKDAQIDALMDTIVMLKKHAVDRDAMIRQSYIAYLSACKATPQ